MDIKYSFDKFEGYTHRFQVEFRVNIPAVTITKDIYTNTGSHFEIVHFIKTHVAHKAKSFLIVGIYSKEMDDATNDLINMV